MRVGINLHVNWPYEEVIAAFAENGIDRTFVCIEHPQFDDAMRALRKAGIAVDNFHAPYKGHNSIWQEGEDGERIAARFLKSIDLCIAHGVSVLVAHASGGRPMPPITEVGIERFDRIIAYAREKGVTVAFESHRYVENVRFMMERYPDAGFCLDTGHEDAFTPGVRYMPMWGGRLVATHISDNEYVCDRDMHMLPFDGHIDFDLTAREIAASGRDVTLMLEVKPDNHERYSAMSPSEYYAAAAKSIRRLSGMVDEYKAHSGGEK